MLRWWQASEMLRREVQRGDGLQEQCMAYEGELARLRGQGDDARALIGALEGEVERVRAEVTRTVEGELGRMVGEFEGVRGDLERRLAVSEQERESLVVQHREEVRELREEQVMWWCKEGLISNVWCHGVE